MRLAICFFIFNVVRGSQSAKVIDCGGSSITFSGQSTDEPIFIPQGQLVVSMLGISKATIPIEVVVIKLITRKSDGYVVPCFDDITGSCKQDVCKFIASYPEHVVTEYPFSACPTPIGHYEFNYRMNFNEDWLGIFRNTTEEYNLRYKLEYNDKLIGCFDVPFTLMRSQSNF